MPSPRSFMLASTTRMPFSTPTTFTDSEVAHSAGSWSSTLPSSMMPALFTRHDTGPYSFSASSTAAENVVRSDTSTLRHMQRGRPSSSMGAAQHPQAARRAHRSQASAGTVSHRAQRASMETCPHSGCEVCSDGAQSMMLPSATTGASRYYNKALHKCARAGGGSGGHARRGVRAV